MSYSVEHVSYLQIQIVNAIAGLSPLEGVGTAGATKKMEHWDITLNLLHSNLHFALGRSSLRSYNSLMITAACH